MRLHVWLHFNIISALAQVGTSTPQVWYLSSTESVVHLVYNMQNRNVRSSSLRMHQAIKAGAERHAGPLPVSLTMYTYFPYAVRTIIVHCHVISVFTRVFTISGLAGLRLNSHVLNTEPNE